jgi:hypothetical protein
VPSAGVSIASPAKGARGDAAAANPVTPVILKNPRLESEAHADSVALEG